MTWILTAEVRNAESEQEAVAKLMDKIMFMLVNNIDEHGSVSLQIEEVEER